LREGWGSLMNTRRYRISLLYPVLLNKHEVLLLINGMIFRFELSLGKLRREPATRWFDESFAAILRSGGNDLHVSSAQHKLPSSFHLTSPCPNIVHHLSGLNNNVQWLFYSYIVINISMYPINLRNTYT